MNFELKWSPSPAEAQAAFEAAATGHPLQMFHDLRASSWEELASPGTRRVMVWPMNHWVIRVVSFDDTHYRIAPDPLTVSEVIYSLAAQYGMRNSGE